MNNKMKNKTIILLLMFAGNILATYSQVTDAESKLKKEAPDTIQGWKKGAVTSLTLSQTSLTNWAAGGENSFAVNGLFSGFIDYRKDKLVWNNTLDLGYGLAQQGKGAEFKKTDDKFDFTSKLGREAFKNVYYSGLLNFKTQMTPGYDYPNDSTKTKISDFMAPAYLLGALGLDYQPNTYLSVFLAPITGRITFVNNQELANAGAFGVKAATYDSEGTLLTEGEKSRYEFGGYFRLSYTKKDFKPEVLKNVAFTTKLDLFSNYLVNPQNIDVNWEVLLAFKVNKYIVVNFNTQLIYDDDIIIPGKTGPGTQFKEILGAGFSYNF
jgi:hypothetical protein